MNIQKEKLQLIQTVMGISDVATIEKIKLYFATIPQQQMSSIPMDIETFYDQIEASEQAYRNGEYISHRELKAQIKQRSDQ